MVIAFLVILLQLFFGHVIGDKHDDMKECDIYNGRWVFDDSYPLYNSSQCDNINMHFNCQKNGRPDEQYLKYRWKPFSCDLPRFSAREFLEKFRNKRIMFIGDSISLNQWESLTCMLHTHTRHSAFIGNYDRGVSTLTFLNHNVSILLSRNQLLVEKASTSYGNVLNLNSISDYDSQIWRDCDILVFNSYLWWLHSSIRTPWDFIRDEYGLHKDMDRMVAYEKALTTWTKWIEKNIDPTKTLVFFRTDAPIHSNASEWGNNDGNQCGEETTPIFGAMTPSLREPRAEVILERVIGKMSKPELVHFLNITKLSMRRKDGHPGAYGSLKHNGMDCNHWCLPGVPDTWNEILYAELLRRSIGKNTVGE